MTEAKNIPTVLRLIEERRELIEQLNNARFFIQDSLTNGHLSGGDVGNLMGARDAIDAAIAKASPTAFPNGATQPAAAPE